MKNEITIGVIPYINVLPFFAGATFQGYRQVVADPRTLGRQLRDGVISSAPIPVYDLWRFSGAIEPLCPLGIAAGGRVYSVLLFSKSSPATLSNTPVAVTAESSTSVRLLWILLKERWGLANPKLQRGPGTARQEAILCIGDTALKRRAELEQDGYHTYDLAQEWMQLTGYPFVFAQWGVCAGTPAAVREDLCRRLDQALDRNLKSLETLYTPAHAEIMGTREHFIYYLSHLTFRFSDAELEGMRCFHDKLQHYDLFELHL